MVGYLVKTAAVEEIDKSHRTPGHQFYKPPVADQMRKVLPPVRENFVLVKVLERSVARAMEGSDDGHYFTDTARTDSFQPHPAEEVEPYCTHRVVQSLNRSRLRRKRSQSSWAR